MAARDHRSGEIAIVDLPRHLISDAAHVIADAFRDESLSRLAFDLDDPRVRQAVARVFTASLEVVVDRSRTVRAAIERERVLGLSVLSSPHVAVSRLRLALEFVVRGPVFLAALRSLRRGARIPWSAAMPPRGLPEPHYSLEFMAVAPQRQGSGIGRLLLDDVHARIDADALAAGCYLVTADERPRRIYERSGYRVVESRPASGGLAVYHMFRDRLGR